jgi:hypothetical protein
MTSFPLRVWRAALLHADTYEEVEADRTSIRQAAVVMFAAVMAVGIGNWFQSGAAGLEMDARLFQLALVVLEIAVLWVGGSAFCFMVGATFFRGPETETDFMEVLRTTGFAFGPSLLRVFAGVQPAAIGLGIDVVARIWVTVAVVVAVRQALDFTTGRAIGTYGIAAVLLWLMLWGLYITPVPF